MHVTSTGSTKGTNVKYEYDNNGEFVSANPIYFRDEAEQTFPTETLFEFVKTEHWVRRVRVGQ